MENKSTCHMTNEKRLIDVNDEIQKIQFVLDEHQNEKDSTAYYAFSALIECLKKTPTVDAVQVVHARWHDVYLLSPWVATGVCGHCKLTSYINPDFPHAKHCPNCGAKMDGGNEDD